VQVAVMFLVLAVVAGVALRPSDRPAGRVAAPLARPLASTDPDVRALAAEVARYRPPAEVRGVAGRLIELLDDPAPEVRRQAHAALVALAGRDAGGEGPGAAGRWRAWARDAGVAR
jgi:HEAT repeat protein